MKVAALPEAVADYSRGKEPQGDIGQVPHDSDLGCLRFSLRFENHSALSWYSLKFSINSRFAAVMADLAGSPERFIVCDY